jgi:hypothetical protein
MTISGQGIDCYLMPVIQKLQQKTKTAIVHAITIKHYRPIRSHQRIYANGLNNEQEIELIRKEALKIVNNHADTTIFDAKFRRIILKEGNKSLIYFETKVLKMVRIFRNSVTHLKEKAHF